LPYCAGKLLLPGIAARKFNCFHVFSSQSVLGYTTKLFSGEEINNDGNHPGF